MFLWQVPFSPLYAFVNCQTLMLFNWFYTVSPVGLKETLNHVKKDQLWQL